jgi:glycosyltransferase involved in cell wall biosynthesis
MRSKAVWLAGLVSIVIVLLGVRAFLDPVAASASFGLPMHTDAETSFVRIYGARNVLLGAMALVLACRGMIRPLVLLFTLATALPLLDATVIVSRIGLGHELVRHGAILLVLATVSVALWRASESRDTVTS